MKTSSIPSPSNHTADQTPSLPDAAPRSARPRCGGRESKFLAAATRSLATALLFALTAAPCGAATVVVKVTIDVTDIRANLLTIGQAERIYLVAHGAYGTIEQLNQDGPPMMVTENRGYVFSATPNGAQSFKVTATPTDPSKAGWPTLTIDETMRVTDSQ